MKHRNRSCIPPGSNCGNYTLEHRACGEVNCQRVAGLFFFLSDVTQWERARSIVNTWLGIKQTEPKKYPLKGYLSIREGDILCVPQNSSTMAKHMADLVRLTMTREENRLIDKNRIFSVRFANRLAWNAELNMVVNCVDVVCTILMFSFYSAALNPIRHNATCYPGIICDGSEKDFYDCKYDRTQSTRNMTDLFAIVARCIGQLADGTFSSIELSNEEINMCIF
jgi:hypothetical protein